MMDRYSAEQAMRLVEQLRDLAGDNGDVLLAIDALETAIEDARVYPGEDD